MSPEYTHKLMGLYMEVLILGVNYTSVHGFCFFNSLLPNDAIWRHDLCELSISLWEFIRGFNTRRNTLVQGFCFFWLFLMGCKELTLYTL